MRETLFRQLIKQDIALFDGMRTGDLTQRLGSDVRAMASPVTVTLSMLISNTLLLVGGGLRTTCYAYALRIPPLPCLNSTPSTTPNP